jgi:hypothetical protein
MDLNPGYQSDVLNAKLSQFVIKMSNTLSYVLRGVCVEALVYVKSNHFILINHVIKRESRALIDNLIVV